MGSLPTYARPNYVPIVTDAFYPKSGGTIASNAQSCMLCHAAAGPPKLNPFGTDVKGALDAAHTKTLTPAILHSIDAKDSDGDGFDNAAEFAADTLPGDAASKSAGAAPQKVQGTPAPAAGNESAPGPFDLKTLLLPRHGQHPVLVHFPIGLFIISLFFDLLALRRKDAMLSAAGYLNLTVAAVTSPMAVISGLLAWQFAMGGISFASLQGTLLQHLVLALVTTLLLWILWWMRFSKRSQGFQTVTTGYIVLGLITLAAISLTGHLGGFLSGVN